MISPWAFLKSGKYGVSHGLIALACGILNAYLGAAAIGFYLGREYTQGSFKDRNGPDGWLDGLVPFVSAPLGLWIGRSLLGLP
jgi:hypothetical protein